MPKNSPSPASKEDIEKVLELLDSRLADAEELAEQVVGLRETVEDLSRNVQTLERTIDDLRSDLDWALHNPEARRVVTARPLTSMPRELASDFAERVNRHSAEDLPPELRVPQSDAPAPSPGQPELF